MQMTSREFNQRTSFAQRQADVAPVIITKRGEPSYVLMTFADYQKTQELSEFKTAKEVLLSLELSDDLAELDFELPVRSTAQRSLVDFGE
ncbi:prevent-host-death family protein [Moraxella lacunata]|uniref:Prevent-host-death family protein n=1 Tax=Moraxella lacunata TaxID=477 RepID=A0A1V4H334_MORLA|nr:type II toxin-antitoxin system prevent-host-death family antitoxin [Moraxella lacunata]OPH39297.1 hypothetical protein B5J94_00440 [Moraxella lacunata]STY99604.1 prevent-host-death family protein [Moraxella lacunata]